MDWKLIQLMLRDHEAGRTKFFSAFTLLNTVKKFGKETEFEEVKKELRIFYKELKAALDKKNKEIPGMISDNRFDEIVDRCKTLIDDYYWKNRIN
jgi:hypothetical protein